MSVVRVFLIVFVIIETLNILELYFMKDNCVFNGLCIFSGWDISKADPEVHRLVRYLINWLAGVKMIVIALVVVLIFTAPEQTLLLAACAMVIAISSFFWRMFPMIRKADKEGQITPKGRSKVLSSMVAFLELGFLVAIFVEIV